MLFRSGYHQAKPLLYFEFIPFDFDADEVHVALEHTQKFVEFLLSLGVPRTHFKVWLSGSKGFHVEVDRSVFDLAHPSADVLRRARAFAERAMRALSIKVDLSLYSSARLYRVPNSKHAKTGLYKTLVDVDDLTEEHVARRAEWAAWPHEDLPLFSHEPVEQQIMLPDVEVEHQETQLAGDLTFDTTMSIISKCPRIQHIMANPENREARRQAAGVLMEAYGSSSAPEVEALYTAFRGNPYMDEPRMNDAEKWRKEFDKDGVVKCPKTCTSFGCGKEQKRICGTKFPSDHLVTGAKIDPITVEEARSILAERMNEAVYAANDHVYAFGMPIGIGKTTKLLELLAADPNLRAAYLCYSHDLAEQVFNDAKALGIEDSRRLMSRVRMHDELNRDDANGFPCPYIGEIKAMQNKSQNITRAVCSKCPRFPARAGEGTCEYFAQFDGAADVRLIVGVHAHANVHTMSRISMETRNFMVVDESPLKTFSGSINAVPADMQVVFRAFGAAATSELLQEVEDEDVDGEELPEVEPEGLFGYVRLLHAREEAEQQRAENARRRITLEEHKAAQRFMYTCMGTLIAGGRVTGDQLAMISQLPYWGCWKKLIERLVDMSKYEPAMALQEGFRHVCFPDVVADAIKCVLDLGQHYSMNQSYFFPNPMPDSKIIILDATSSRPLYERMIEAGTSPTDDGELIKPLHYFKLPYVEQTHAKVTQVTNSGYGKSRLKDDERAMDGLMYVLKTIRTVNPAASLLFVSVMELKQAIEKDLSNTSSGHYGAMRGSNAYEDYDFEVIVGGFFVSNEAIVEGLHRLGMHNVDIELLEAATIAVRNKHVARDGGTYFSQRKAFKSLGKRDPMSYANALYEQAAVSEVVQAVRVRLFSGKPDKSCIILTNIGLTTIYADRFMTLQEIAAELEDESGVQSDINTEIVRRDDLMLAKLFRVEVGAIFKLADIDDDEAAARRFVVQHQNVGTVKRIGPKTYEKLAEVGKSAVQAPKESKQVVHARLDL